LFEKKNERREDERGGVKGKKGEDPRKLGDKRKNLFKRLKAGPKSASLGNNSKNHREATKNKFEENKEQLGKNGPTPPTL